MIDREEVGDIRGAMQELLKQEGLQDLDDLLLIKEAWEKIAGKDTAGITKPYRLEEGRLYVGVESHARVQDVRFRAEEIRGGIKEILGMELREVLVRKINLK